jgi:hypothetical protein
MQIRSVADRQTWIVRADDAILEDSYCAKTLLSKPQAIRTFYLDITKRISVATV